MPNFKRQISHTPRLGKPAFTLIETVLYLAIAGSMLLAIAGFLSLALQARSRFQAISEVDGQGTYIMSVLAQNLRAASVINNPAAGTSGASLSLTVPGAADNPVVFSVNSGVLTETIGGSAAYSLNSPAVSVSSLQFSNFSTAGGLGLVRAELTLSYNGQGGYNYQANFYDSISLNP